MLRLLSELNPFRFRYWLDEDVYRGVLRVRRSRWSNPNLAESKTAEYALTDGPFDSSEDAARSLQFWVRQYTYLIGDEDSIFCDDSDLDE